MENDKIIIYQTEDGQTQIDVRLENETVWLNVEQLSLLFNREESNVRRHIINVFIDIQHLANFFKCFFIFSVLTQCH